MSFVTPVKLDRISWAKSHSDAIRTMFSTAMSNMYRAEVPQYGELIQLVSEDNAWAPANDPQLERTLRRDGELDRLALERHGAIRLGTAQGLFSMRRVFAVIRRRGGREGVSAVARNSIYQVVPFEIRYGFATRAHQTAAAIEHLASNPVPTGNCSVRCATVSKIDALPSRMSDANSSLEEKMT